MKYIYLTQGKRAKVSDHDFEELSLHKWRYHSQGYACRWDYGVKPKKMVLMHRQIMQTPTGLETDHINRDKLDNQRRNLRCVTISKNRHNTGLPKNNTSGYKGVVKNSPNRYRAVIVNNKVQYYLGSFKTPQEAYKVYLKAKESYV